MQLPSFRDLCVKTVEILTEKIGEKVTIETYTGYDDVLLAQIMAIDHQKFRKDLRYNKSELRKRLNNQGFFCIMIYIDEKPIAFDYGYDDDVEKTYFSDSSATLIERKGFGGYLGVLELVYLYEKGYERLNFETEEMDDAGRPLREIWENMGYRTVSTAPQGEVTMTMEITNEIVAKRVQKMYPVQS